MLTRRHTCCRYQGQGSTRRTRLRRRRRHQSRARSRQQPGSRAALQQRCCASLSGACQQSAHLRGRASTSRATRTPSERPARHQKSTNSLGRRSGGTTRSTPPSCAPRRPGWHRQGRARTRRPPPLAGSRSPTQHALPFRLPRYPPCLNSLCVSHTHTPALLCNTWAHKSTDRSPLCRQRRGRRSRRRQAQGRTTTTPRRACTRK